MPNPDEPQKGVLISVPLFHATGNHSLLQVYTLGGAKIVLMPRWDVEEAVRLIQSEGLTCAGGVPNMVFEIVAHGGKALESLDTLSHGGAPAAESMPAAANKKYPQVHLSAHLLTQRGSLELIAFNRPMFSSQGYGLSEFTSAMALCPSGLTRNLSKAETNAYAVGFLGEDYLARRLLS